MSKKSNFLSKSPKDLILEALVIVFSILLAFWIDARWQLHQESVETIQNLAALREEIHENIRILKENIQGCESGSFAAAKKIFILTKPNPEPISPDSLSDLFIIAMRAGGSDLQTAALDALLASGVFSKLGSTELEVSLNRWRSTVDQRRSRRQAIFLQVQKLIDHLSDAGIAGHVMAKSRVIMPESNFPLDTREVLKNSKMEGIIGNLAVLIGHNCVDDPTRLELATGEILPLLESQIND